MKYKHRKPPHWRFITWFFPTAQWERTAFAFGDHVYAKEKIPDHVEAHEAVHLDQQWHSPLGAVIWWTRYFLSKKFRYRQELAAYRVQWIYVRKHYNTHRSGQILEKIASDLSGDLYGRVVTFKEARDAITR